MPSALRQPGFAAQVPAPAAGDAGGRQRGHPPRPGAGRASTAPASSWRRPARSTATRSVHPQREDYWGNVNPVGPRSVYDEAKRFAEALTMAWHRAEGVDVGIVRIFNTYGPRLRAGRRPGRLQLPGPGPERPAAHGLRRRQPDAQPLLRLRRGGRVAGVARLGPHGTGEHRQSGRDHRSSNWPAPSSSSRDRLRRSSTSRCRSTTRPAGVPTSHSARRVLGWEPVVRSPRGWHHRRLLAALAASTCHERGADA